MNVRRRSGLMNQVVGSACANTVTTRKDAQTQAGPIKNTVSKPKAVGPSRIGNAVNGPNSTR